MSEIASFNPQEKKLDNEIKSVSAGFYLAENGRVASEFLQENNEVIFVNKDRRISWTPQNMRYLDEFGGEDVIYNVQEVPLEVKGNYARYNRTMPDVDDWFIQENDRLKHQILIQGFQPDPSPFLFGEKIDFAIGGKMKFDDDLKIVADGIKQVNMFETEGGIQLYDGNELVFELPQIVAFDSNFDRSMTLGKYRVWFNNQAEMMFDIVVDYAWISSLERVYPIVIDPTVIVNSGYSTAGNGGRKGAELSNGWLVTAVYDSTNKNMIFFKSSDKGTTWTQLCYSSSNTYGFIGGASLVSKDTFVYAISQQGSVLNTVFWKFDATVQTNVDINSTITNIDTGQNGIDSHSLIINGAGTEIHAVWSSGNASYLNSNNIRYKKGTIDANGNVSWGSSQQLTTQNETGTNNYFPTIVLQSNGNPTIIFSRMVSSATHYLKSLKYNGSSWVEYDITPANIYSRQQVSGVVDKNGSVHCVWQGSDGTDNNYINIRYSKSTDGGSVWTSEVKLTSGNTVNRRNASITCDKNNKLYVTYDDNGTIKRITSTDNGATWSAPITIEAGTNPNMFFDPTYTKNLVPTVYMSGSSVKFDKIELNQPPNAPNLSSRSNYDATGSAVFSWAYSDPDPSDTQSAYQLQVKDVETGTNVIDTGKVASTTSSRTVAAATLTNGKQYQWRVKTWDSSDVEGVWSTYATFYTSVKPSGTITNITEGQTYIQSSLTLEWSMSDPESEGQGAYQVKLTTPTDTVLYDSGKVTDSRARSRTIPYTLINNTSYKVKLTVWDAKDVQGTEVSKSFNVTFTPPVTPELDTTTDTDRGSISVEVINDDNVISYANPLTANFVGKVAGSTVENPHVAKRTSGGTSGTTSLLIPSSVNWVDFDSTFYASVTTLNNNNNPVSATNNGAISQQLFSFNLIEEYKRKIGLTLSVQQVKDVTKKLTANWHGFGSSVGGNKATFKPFRNDTNQYYAGFSHTGSGVQKLSQTLDTQGDKNVAIDPNGVIHFIAYAEPSDGVTPSTINTDYIELLTQFDYKALMATLPKVISNEVYRRIIGENEWKRVGYVTPALYSDKNLLPPFTEWTLHANATVKSPYELELNPTGITQKSSIRVKVSGGNTYFYTIASSDNSNTRNYIYKYDKNGFQVGATLSLLGTVSQSFVFESNVSEILIEIFSFVSSGTFTFTNPQLELGTTATAFEPQKLGGTFTDYTPKSGQLYEYKAKAIGNNGTSVESAAVGDLVEIQHAQLSSVSDPSKWVKLVYKADKSEDRSRNRVLSEFAGRTAPVPEFGEQKRIAFGLGYEIYTKEDLEMLKEIIDRDEILLYRDSRGRREFVSIDSLSIKDEQPDYWSVSFNADVSAYVEGV